MGMELVSITSQYELNIVLAAIALSGYSNHYFYIGYDDVTTEGTYVWKSGSAQMQGYQPWSQDSVFDDSKDCTILRSQNSDWYSVTCSTSYYHVCELGKQNIF
ncbi:snaclec stejaggregin-A subunit beta-1-like, partial [Anneissia japonica]|uniref:snaclec stejaggregin-A subunit beta-1-like n=1 Tax=Anneissia japonica TaxID=1529436 RepID=UPI0014257061